MTIVVRVNTSIPFFEGEDEALPGETVTVADCRYVFRPQIGWMMLAGDDEYKTLLRDLAIDKLPEGVNFNYVYDSDPQAG